MHQPRDQFLEQQGISSSGGKPLQMFSFNPQSPQIYQSIKQQSRNSVQDRRDVENILQRYSQGGQKNSVEPIRFVDSRPYQEQFGSMQIPEFHQEIPKFEVNYPNLLDDDETSLMTSLNVSQQHQQNQQYVINPFLKNFDASLCEQEFNFEGSQQVENYDKFHQFEQLNLQSFAPPPAQIERITFGPSSPFQSQSAASNSQSRPSNSSNKISTSHQTQRNTIEFHSPTAISTPLNCNNTPQQWGRPSQTNAYNSNNNMVLPANILEDDFEQIFNGNDLPTAEQDQRVNQMHTEVSVIQDQVHRMLQTYKSQLDQHSNKQVVKQKVKGDAQCISKNYQEILRKFQDMSCNDLSVVSQLSHSNVSRSGFGQNNSFFRPDTNNAKEKEINVMMNLVEQFLTRFDSDSSSNLASKAITNQPLQQQTQQQPVVITQQLKQTLTAQSNLLLSPQPQQVSLKNRNTYPEQFSINLHSELQPTTSNIQNNNEFLSSRQSFGGAYQTTQGKALSQAEPYQISHSHAKQQPSLLTWDAFTTGLNQLKQAPQVAPVENVSVTSTRSPIISSQYEQQNSKQIFKVPLTVDMKDISQSQRNSVGVTTIKKPETASSLLSNQYFSNYLNLASKPASPDPSPTQYQQFFTRPSVGFDNLIQQHKQDHSDNPFQQSAGDVFKQPLPVNKSYGKENEELVKRATVAGNEKKSFIISENLSIAERLTKDSLTSLMNSPTQYNQPDKSPVPQYNQIGLQYLTKTNQQQQVDFTQTFPQGFSEQTRGVVTTQQQMASLPAYNQNNQSDSYQYGSSKGAVLDFDQFNAPQRQLGVQERKHISSDLNDVRSIASTSSTSAATVVTAGMLQGEVFEKNDKVDLYCTNCDKYFLHQSYFDHVKGCDREQAARMNQSMDETCQDLELSMQVMDKLDLKIEKISKNFHKTLELQSLPQTRDILSETIRDLTAVLKTENASLVKQIIRKLEANSKGLVGGGNSNSNGTQLSGYSSSQKLYLYLKRVTNLLREKETALEQSAILKEISRVYPKKRNFDAPRLSYQIQSTQNNNEFNGPMRNTISHNQELEKKSKFYDVAGAMKSKLPKSHPAASQLISELYNEARNLDESQWVSYLNNKFRQ